MDVSAVNERKGGVVTKEETQCGTGGLEVKTMFMAITIREDEQMLSRHTDLEVYNIKFLI